MPVCVTPEQAFSFADQEVAASKAIDVMGQYPEITIVPITFVRQTGGEWIALHG